MAGGRKERGNKKKVYKGKAEKGIEQVFGMKNEDIKTGKDKGMGV